jgi:hypothetical protein
MKESEIKAVSAALARSNPLGEHADLISDLDGYSTEAIDIISMLSLSAGKLSTSKAISEVLTEAFGLPLDETAVQDAANEIDQILGVKKRGKKI